jgi:membrane protease YdiL (CAAX protease family)
LPGILAADMGVGPIDWAKSELDAPPGLPADRALAAWRALAALGGLGLVVAIRWQIFRTQALDGVMEGVVFGLGLLAVARFGGLRASRPQIGALAAGVAAGVLLAALPLLTRSSAVSPALGHAASFVPWVAATTLVATGEELVLRGSLWRWTAAAGGDAAALLVTSLVFALIHIPVYGPAAVPLDLGVGLVFGGLRIWFGGPAAPAVAHVVADLATWWL